MNDRDIFPHIFSNSHDDYSRSPEADAEERVMKAAPPLTRALSKSAFVEACMEHLVQHETKFDGRAMADGDAPILFDIELPPARTGFLAAAQLMLALQARQALEPISTVTGLDDASPYKQRYDRILGDCRVLAERIYENQGKMPRLRAEGALAVSLGEIGYSQRDANEIVRDVNRLFDPEPAKGMAR